MAEIFVDGGLDIILAIWPKGGTNLTTTYLGLFTSQTASTVVTSGQAMGNITEVSGGAYARQSLAAATWGAAAAGSGTRKTTYSQITFPTCTVAWGTVNGAFIADAASAGNLIAAFNMDDTTAINVQVGDIVKVTPRIEFGN